MAFHQGNQKQKSQRVIANNVLESLRDITGDVSHAVTNDVGKQIPTTALDALLGKPLSGNLSPNESIEFPHNQDTKQVEKTPPIRRPENHLPIMRSDEAYVKQQLDAIRTELKALAQSVQSLNKEIKNAVISDPIDPGIYHLNFYEQLLSFIKTIRMQVEDSRTWLALSNQRKKKKMGYWGMYKKHGTTFGLSTERTLATQAG